MEKVKPCITVYITKYWQTRGIIEAVAEVCSSVASGDMIKTVGVYPAYYHKPWWHESMEEALKHAEQQRQKKIKALEKQLVTVRKMLFQ